MTIKAKLISAYMIISILVLVLLGIEYFSIVDEKYKIKRLNWMYQEYSHLVSLNTNLLREMKETADFFISDEPLEREEYDRAVFNVMVSFENIKNVIEVEKSFLKHHDEKVYEQKEESEYDVIWRRYSDLNREIENVFTESRNNKDNATEILIGVLEKRFDHELIPIIDKWLKDEEADLLAMSNEFVASGERQHLIISLFSSIILVVVVVLSFSINHLIANRLKMLMSSTKEIAKGNVQIEVDTSGNDELSHLAASFNYMVAQLTDTKNKLLEQSYYSGMAEISSGMLHNLKNVFAPLIVRLDAMKISAGRINVETLSTAVGELVKDESPSERRDKLLEYVDLSLQNLQMMISEINKHVASMSERTSTIERILEGQNYLAYAERPLEKISLVELVKDTLQLVKKVLVEDIMLDIDQSLAGIGQFKSHRIVLLQILANVIMNAAESINRAEEKNGLIAISAQIEDKDGRKVIHLKIKDNGEGIDPVRLEKIFQRGFSSKKNVSSGLGLHWCANSMSALKGRMYAESLGLGAGITMHLLIPVNLEKE